MPSKFESFDLLDTDQKIVGKRHWFVCPGCGQGHAFEVRKDGTKWTLNGSVEYPTVTPSLMVTMERGDCHFFIREGRIEYQPDCFHDMRGKTVDLPDMC